MLTAEERERLSAIRARVDAWRWHGCISAVQSGLIDEHRERAEIDVPFLLDLVDRGLALLAAARVMEEHGDALQRLADS
jgi:hypothetical protein